MSCNVKFYDIVSHFQGNSEVYWRTNAAIEVNDFVYLYIGNPYREIMFKCKVVNNQIEKDFILRNAAYAIRGDKEDTKRTRYLKLQLDSAFQKGTFTYEKLKAHGLGQVQKTARVDRKLLQYMENVESEVDENA